MMRVRFSTVGASALLLCTAACGDGLQARVGRAMDGCLAVRSPQFANGAGATALETPLPAAVDSLAMALRYKAAFEQFQGIADEAQSQSVLVCALELGAYYPEPTARRWLDRYRKHPNEPVVVAAQRLLDKPPGR